MPTSRTLVRELEGYNIDRNVITLAAGAMGIAPQVSENHEFHLTQLMESALAKLFDMDYDYLALSYLIQGLGHSTRHCMDRFCNSNGTEWDWIRAAWIEHVNREGTSPIHIMPYSGRERLQSRNGSYDLYLRKIAASGQAHMQRLADRAYTGSATGFVREIFNLLAGLCSTGAITNWSQIAAMDIELFRDIAASDPTFVANATTQYRINVGLRRQLYTVELAGIGVPLFIWFINRVANGDSGFQMVPIFSRLNSESPVECSLVWSPRATIRTTRYRTTQGEYIYTTYWCLAEADGPQCHFCGGRHSAERTRVFPARSGDVPVCEDCADPESGNLRRCVNCGCMAAHVFQADGMCRRCSPRGQNAEIRSYSDDPSFVPRDQGDHHYGVELEVVAKPNTTREEVAPMLAEYWAADAIIKNDGSLPAGGLEIATSPATLAWHREKWIGFLKTDAAKSRLRAWLEPACGLHVHISKCAFTPILAAKAGMFITSHEITEPIWDLFARSSNNYCRATRKSFGDSMIHAGERYDLWNCRNTNTYELRGFKASLNPRRLLSSLDFADAVVYYVRIPHLSHAMMCNWQRFKEFILDNFDRWPYLWNRLQHGTPWVKGKVKGKPAPVEVASDIEDTGNQ